ncbi:hypothetical protein RWA02_17080 [Sinorhizobium meliloti]|uniref:Transcriptional regulator n=1 Tax=Rhizobium meliloti TaxID=382 RepID=A0AAW9TU75_RHIML|nr:MULTISPECIES: hypothetical protein [Sinorhizobium]PST25596.1 hypothetical protein C7U62_13140 [Mesorhizobium loti]TWB00491.1 hypothetical protein FB000_10940 [Ensifer sp. SEMIA 134]TWB35538.1 hypothetical protein FB001_10840 [Ensifer sp. SEMIA 135]MDE3766219.1 hypothetical protein [Sinorhizobium meliloti]MDE3781156.1 hypothetical protein [Sinorhizobium meliloti]
MTAKTPAEHIINELGGLTKTARLLSTDDRRVPVSTVQGWKDRGKIPQEYWIPIIDAAKSVGKAIDLSEFLAVPEQAA